jgi:4-hydroxy-3-polyprenylbenzoate decarboxylase
MAANRRVVVAITGASGAIYAVRLLQVLALSDVEVHLTISPSGAAVIDQELGIKVDLSSIDIASLLTFTPTWQTTTAVTQLTAEASTRTENFQCHRHDNFITPIASGSFLTDAMVICPCSGTTLSGISRAAGANLIQRAAEVHMKERRKLVLVPRETPLSTIQLENMHRLSLAGAVILPAMPGWYHGVDGLDSLVHFVVSRILDQIGIDNQLLTRWGD